MSDTTFSDTTGTPIVAAWLNDVNSGTYGLRIDAGSPVYGVVGDSTTDNAAALQAAINAAEALVTSRFLAGVAVQLPKGTIKLNSGVSITTSNITLLGAEHSGSVLYAPDSTIDMVTFDGTSLALYQCGIHNIRFYTPGNATAGAHLTLNNCINFTGSNITSVGWYDGIVLDGCGKVTLNNIILSQENRTAATTPRYAFDFKSTTNNNSDIHINNWQVTFDTATQVTQNSISIRGADGIYFSNGHQQGAVLLQPTTVTCASVMWSNVYFDQSTNNNVIFSGTSAAYRNFQFSNCRFRASGGNGISFNTASTLSNILFSNCLFDAHRLNGIICDASVPENLTITGCIFSGNNTDNAASTGDLYIRGKASIIGNRFIGGGAAGTSVNLISSATHCLVKNNAFTESTATTKIADAGTLNYIGGNLGFATKNYGQAVITNPATSVVVNHGLAVTPSIANISVTPNTDFGGAFRFWVDSVTSTQFTINVNTTPGTSITFNWQADAGF